MTDEIKYMSIAEFRELGFLQEVNRQVLHPCGLALEIDRAEDGTETFGGVWDYREDPEGVAYRPDVMDPHKAQRVLALMEEHADARIEMFGDIIQPLPVPDPDEMNQKRNP